MAAPYLRPRNVTLGRDQVTILKAFKNNHLKHPKIANLRHLEALLTGCFFNFPMHLCRKKFKQIERRSESIETQKFSNMSKLVKSPIYIVNPHKKRALNGALS